MALIRAEKNNPFKAPSEHSGALSSYPGYYVVGMRKFAILYVCTIGIYAVYLHYAHWKARVAAGRARGWPIARAIFMVIYVFPLFDALSEEAKEAGYEPAWNPTANALLFAVAFVGSDIATRLGNDPGEFEVLNVAGLVLLLFAGLPMAKAQRLANRLAGDADGSSNALLTGWSLLVVLPWALLLTLLGTLIVLNALIILGSL